MQHFLPRKFQNLYAKEKKNNFFPAPVKASAATWADKLKKDLLLNYDRNLRPTQYYNVTNVEVK